VYRVDLSDGAIPESPIVSLEDLGITWEDASFSSLAIDEANNRIILSVRMSYFESADLYMGPLDSPKEATLVYEMSDSYVHAQSLQTHPSNGNIIIGTTSNTTTTASSMLEVDPDSGELVCDWAFSELYYDGLHGLSVH
jgi:hypothetical protein